MTTRYDPRTAITFLLAGLGVGAMLAMILAPRHAEMSIPLDRPINLTARDSHWSRAV